MSSEPSVFEATFDRSADGYRARSESLLKAAADTHEPGAVRALEALALEWRKLAIEADWQTAMLTALEAHQAKPSPTGPGRLQQPGSGDPTPERERR